ncbi:BTAD domain-containing putative transcriptional regulator [Sphaerisporangium sp. TRM90804]|uniref:AfsR/SARP family transcriptional regulator n=1 Tax=Sphaerisporangium sp. TRM90804 TaxID=3031113 RepID=UPI00244A505B|nr:BTAD domain-containing putative transcriptional regulator [Sphaerisporangium sp. TRM90804]MDH2424419.1 BTAD domain-containing putative transcriptional regulator [Sphaerisporangium sp. TRM90804]
MTTSEAVAFRVLGPLAVFADGREVPVAGNQVRVVLAGLLLRSGETIPAARLARWLWDREPESGHRAKATVQSYVNRLRAVPGVRDVLRTTPAGYRVEPGAGALDLTLFRDLAASARHALATGDGESALGHLSRAVELWREPVLANVDSPALHRDEVAPLVEEWLLVQEQWVDANLRAGRHGELVPRLRELTRAHPLREPFWERLMLALHRAGRPAEALHAYHALSAVLAEELGVYPGPALRALHQAILTDDPSLPAVPAAPAGSRADVPAVPVPRQLRPDVPGFAGRRAELAALDLLLEDTARQDGTTVVSLQGMAGSGKTALAVHWAHRRRASFPGGQLYLDLRGYGGGRPVEPAAALETLLRALGTPADRVPAGLEERASLFRTLLAGRRALVLLDNAGGSDQVRPLVPGSDAMMIVTSRNQLRGLVVQYGARRVVLDQMRPEEASELLTEVLGTERVASAPEAVAEIIERCARLPLALRIFAERAARFPGVPLGRLVGDLRDERTRLAALDTGDGDDTDLRTVFSWTYHALNPRAARLFRLLGLHPGPEVSTAAAAALAGGDAAAVARLLDRLTADHLLRSRSPGRYDFHDLLRAYAAEQAREAAAEEDPGPALARLMEWYAHAARQASDHLPPGGRSLPAEPPPSGLAPVRFAGTEQAVAWYEEELANLVAAVRAAAARGWHGLALRLARALAPFAGVHVPGPLWVDVCRAAVTASRRLGDTAEEGWALVDLACAHVRLGRLREAVARYGDALTAARRVRDRDLEGEVLADLGAAHFRLGDHARSARCHGEALAIARESGDRGLEAETLNNIARNDNELGRHERALAGGGASLAVATELGDRYRRAEALRTIGVAHAGLGRPKDAAVAFHEAAAGLRAFEDRRGEADVLPLLARALDACGDRDGAEDARRRGEELAAELDAAGWRGPAPVTPAPADPAPSAPERRSPSAPEPRAPAAPPSTTPPSLRGSPEIPRSHDRL